MFNFATFERGVCGGSGIIGTGTIQREGEPALGDEAGEQRKLPGKQKEHDRNRERHIAGAGMVCAIYGATEREESGGEAR